MLARARAAYEQYRILVWACLLIFVNQIGFGSIVPVVPLYADSFGVSQFLIGMTIAIYGLARFAMNVPTARIADAYGRRVALAIGGSCTVVGNIISGFSEVYWQFLAGRLVAGAGAAMVITGTQIVVTDISKPSNRGRMLAIYMGVFMFAVGIGPVPGGFLAEWISLSAPFLIYAVLGSVVALLAWFKIPETRDEATLAARVNRVTPGIREQFRILTASTGFLLVSMVAFTQFFARTGGLFNLIPPLADDKIGLSPGQIGLGLGLISVMGLLIAYPAGVLVDRFGRKIVIVPSAILAGVSMWFFAVAPDYTGFLLACGVWAVASGMAGAAPAAYAADSAPPGMNAAAMGTFRMLADSGYILGPLLLGLTADLISAETALYIAGAMVVTAGLAFAIRAPETYRRADQLADSSEATASDG